jgi:TonB family protein
MLRLSLVVCCVSLVAACGAGSPSSPLGGSRTAASAHAPRVAPAEEPGLEEDEIRSVVEAKNGAVRGCHAIEFIGRDSSGGTVTVDLEINPDGSVASAEITDSDFESRTMHDCVLDITRRLRFPEARGSTDISWRFRFRSQDGGGAARGDG